jgi:hypothetical protein
MNADNSLRSAWRAQSVWSTTANDLKRSIARWRGCLLLLVVVGAVLETLAAQLGAENGAGAGFAGAVALALAPVIRLSRLGRDRVRDWTRARSVSESLKKEIYIYLTGTGAYAGDDRDEVLRKVVDGTLRKVQDLETQAAKAQPTEKPLPSVPNLESYLDVRVQGQIEGYYHPKAKQLARRLDLLRRGELVLTLGAAAVGGAATYGKISALGGWVGVLTTAAAAIVAHAEASRYEHSIISYRTTARRLESLRDAWRDRRQGGPPSAEEAHELVAQCEQAISIENQGWMTAWTEGGTAQGT